MHLSIDDLLYNVFMNSYDTYYPRPLLKRNSFYSLNGEWDLNGKPIQIPFPPQSEASGYQGEINDELIYQKTFVLPQGFYHSTDKVLLHFGAIDQICDVYLNEQYLLSHEGGYLPFFIDISEYLKEENHLKIFVKDDLNPFYPYGKQSKNPQGMWYTPVSGIWQSVWIEAYPKDGIDDLLISTDMHTLHLEIFSESNSFTVSFDGFEKSYHEHIIDIPIAHPHLWSIQDPYLYPLTIQTESDTVHSYFALREVRVEKINGYFRTFLNHDPIFFNGLLDQGYFEKGIFTPEDPEEYEDDISRIKALGYNMLRKHIKIEPEAFYYECDRHGILVMQDMVNSGDYHFFTDTILPTIGLQHLKRPIKDQKRYDFFLQHCKDTIRHLKSHPCIFAYTIYNEGWGQQEASETYDELKQLDPDRLFDSASGWFFDENSDFDSYHIYFRNKVLKAGKRILLLSECGGFIRDICQNSTKKAWGYGRAESEEELTDKIIEMQEKMYIPSIRKGLCGAIMTQISDIEGEINGLFTYDRSICKVNQEKILQANQRLRDVYQETCK